MVEFFFKSRIKIDFTKRSNTSPLKINKNANIQN